MAKITDRPWCAEFCFEALAYFYTRSRDGLILFFNGPNTFSLGAITEAIALLDPDSPMLGYYQSWYREQLAGRD